MTHDLDSPTGAPGLASKARVAVLEAEVRNLASSVGRLAEKLDELTSGASPFVTQREFWPVRAIVYATVGLVGTAVVVALLALVVRAG